MSWNLRTNAAMSKVFLLFLMFAGFVLGPLPRSDAAELRLTGLSHSAEGARLRLRLGVSEETVFSLFTLTNPFRIMLDLPVFEWQAGEVDPASIPGVAAIRHGLFTHETARIVLELDSPLAVRSAALAAGQGGPAIELELEPVSVRRFAASAGWPEGARWAPGALPKAQGEGEILVAIDPGHGGLDPGASFGDLVEKDLVLAFGQALAQEVVRTPGLRAFLTRNDDRFIPLRERVKLARRAGAHLFVSVHADSLLAGEADGVSIYTLSTEGTDRAAELFAERENRSDVLAGVNLSGNEDDVTRLLIDLARRGTKAESVKLADSIVAQLTGRVALLSTRPHRRGNFFVLKAPDLPSVLIEIGFLTSEFDRERLVDPEWQAATIDGIVRGILAWVKVASPGFLAPRGG